MFVGVGIACVIVFLLAAAALRGALNGRELIAAFIVMLVALAWGVGSLVDNLKTPSNKLTATAVVPTQPLSIPPPGQPEFYPSINDVRNPPAPERRADLAPKVNELNLIQMLPAATQPAHVLQRHTALDNIATTGTSTTNVNDAIASYDRRVEETEAALGMASNELNRATAAVKQRKVAEFAPKYNRATAELNDAQAALADPKNDDQRVIAATNKWRAKAKLAQLDQQVASAVASDVSLATPRSKLSDAQFASNAAILNRQKFRDGVQQQATIQNPVEAARDSAPHLGPSRNRLIDKIHRRVRFESNPFLNFLDEALGRGRMTVSEVLADPANRMAVERSPLAREMIAAYQNDPDAFAEAEADEPPVSYQPVPQSVLATIRRSIDKGATANEIFAGSDFLEVARHDPALQRLYEEALRRNGP